jgi:carbon-monoxide dehydrogenase small subunit
MARVSLTVDGVKYVDDVQPRTLLVQYLRDQLGKVGTVIGCDTGNCGACTVLLATPDGAAQAVKSCSVLAVQADGGEVTTVEGLAAAGRHAAPRSARIPRTARASMWLLYARHDHCGGRPVAGKPTSQRG